MKDKKRRLRAFLCHASGDKSVVKKLHQCLVWDGIDAWLDKENLIPGQDWSMEIPNAVKSSDVVIVCLSARSVTKEGYVQKEIKLALDTAAEKPEGEIFIIPARLEDCTVPGRIQNLEWVDLFLDDGYERLIKALQVRARSLGISIRRRTKPSLTLNQDTEKVGGTAGFYPKSMFASFFAVVLCIILGVLGGAKLLNGLAFDATPTMTTPITTVIETLPPTLTIEGRPILTQAINTTQTEEELATETSAFPTETQAPIASSTRLPASLTRTSRPTMAPQPINPPTATSIPDSPTNIPPLDTPLSPTETPIVIPTDAPLLSFDSLPSAQGWQYESTFTHIPESWIFSVDGSQLHMNSMMQGESAYAYRLDTPIDRQLPFTLNVRARVTNYGDDTNDNPWGFTLSVLIGYEQFAIGIRPNRIVGGVDTDLMPLNPIDVNQFHWYRIEGKAGQDFRIFVDGNLLGSAPPEVTSIEHYALKFGDTTRGANAQADITSYSFTQEGP